MKLIYITSNPHEALLADRAGVDFVMVDLEVNGKHERQKGRDTLISNHTLADVKQISQVLTSSKLLVRINPIWSKSSKEIESAIEMGADALMLPMFRNRDEVSEFISLVNGRAECQILLETKSGLENIDSILELEGIAMVHVGLNDLHQELKLKFMFELFLGDLLKKLGEKVAAKGIGFGIGGVARPNSNQLVAPQLIMNEHRRLGSSQVILSRDFRNIFLESKSEQFTLFEEDCRQIREAFKSSDLLVGEQLISRERLVKSILDASNRIVALK